LSIADRILLPDVSTVEDPVERLRLSSATIRKLLRQGVLPGCKIGGRWPIERQQLLAALRTAAAHPEVPAEHSSCANCRHPLNELGGLTRANLPLRTECASRPGPEFRSEQER